MRREKREKKSERDLNFKYIKKFEPKYYTFINLFIDNWKLTLNYLFKNLEFHLSKLLNILCNISSLVATTNCMVSIKLNVTKFTNGE